MTIEQIEISDPKYTADNVTQLTIHSSHIGGRQDVSVYSQPTKNKDIPIVLLLHGVYGSNWVWMNMGGVHLVYEQLRKNGLDEFILVMPSDGGLWQGSAYLPLVGQGDFEQWIMDDVLTAVTQHIPGASTDSKLFISGLSMGGYGALRLGAKFAPRFTAISAHSAVTNMTDLQSFIQNPVSDYQCNLPQETDLLYWFRQQAAHIPPIRMDCGKDDKLLRSNNALSKALSELNIKHSYEVYEGGHEWSYWHKHVAKTLKYFSTFCR